MITAFDAPSPKTVCVAVFQRSQSVIGNRHAVRVAGQILENPLRTRKRRLDVHDPIDRESLLTQCSERRLLGQRTEFPAETERAFAISLL